MQAAVTLFFSLGTQWRTAPTGGLLGLEYQAIRPLAENLEIEWRPSIMMDLRMMEDEALQVFSERQKRRGRR